MLLAELSSEPEVESPPEMPACRLSMMFMSCATSCSAVDIEDCSSVEGDEEDNELLLDELLPRMDDTESSDEDDVEPDFWY